MKQITLSNEEGDKRENDDIEDCVFLMHVLYILRISCYIGPLINSSWNIVRIAIYGKNLQHFVLRAKNDQFHIQSMSIRSGKNIWGQNRTSWVCFSLSITSLSLLLSVTQCSESVHCTWVFGNGELALGFLNFCSHFMAVQIFQIDLPFILSASKYFR